MGQVADLITKANTDSGTSANDAAALAAAQAALVAVQAAMASDDKAVCDALTAIGGQALVVTPSADGITFTYQVAAAVPPDGFTLTAIPVA